MNSMMQLIRTRRAEQFRPSVIVPDLVVNCSYCDNPFDVERNEFCPYCFTDTFCTWVNAVFGKNGLSKKSQPIRDGGQDATG